MIQEETLALGRCPHCNVAVPHMALEMAIETVNSGQNNLRTWAGYACRSCGGVVLTSARGERRHAQHINGIWPSAESVDEAIPPRPRAFLQQAISSLHAPAGAVMLCASSVDSMLKESGLKTGSLYERIEKAAAQHLITKEMAAWAHEVRLDANDQRHADDLAELPEADEAKRAVEFVQALGQFLFVLPSRVRRGRGKG
ncbi:DUF4145 domain-containing protein [Pseudomonas sp. N2-11]|uniref:DUF4145 domain-containing protein n=1 Tax=Pseudomonas sp. N2-11 TaxID=2962038 RepID=UPI0020B79C7D|nr:DUF4145 domain-containing protein [Pseudomonas sp. N2-11]MCP3789468.1 DUF4145 domain-containing protein [Pseudomonas sp. N2-11]